ncbi:MAG TPA: DUF167 domain-containing protein [Bacteroidota bacterium]|jgi:uncharacterized protein (TIGR00251 family)|nr:DUF167 domain-containing protein [Bacteroidota bacterium]
MKITVYVKPNSKRDSIETISKNELKIHVSAPPIEGRANKKLIELISEFYKVPKSAVNIKTGTSSKVKIIDISGI